MNKVTIISLASCFLVFATLSANAQTDPDSLINGRMVFELKNDTLFSSTGLTFFVGQQLFIGEPAGTGEQYRSIISRKAAIVPSIWGQDKRYDNAIENYVDSKKNKEKLKSSLLPGKVVTVQGMGLVKDSKPRFYIVGLSSGPDGYKCDIKLALLLKEILLQPR